MDELNLSIVAAVEPDFAGLEQRIRDLEAAVGDLRVVRAEGSVGRKTAGQVSVLAKGSEAVGGASVDEALRSLSVEQRIAVKSGLMRAGLMR